MIGRIAKFYLASAAVVGMAFHSPSALACGGVFDVGCNLSNGGLSPGNIVKQTGKVIDDGANAVTKGLQDGGNAIGKGINDGVNAVVKGVDDSGHAIETAAHQTGDALEKAAHDSGHAFEGAGQFVGKHPWETVIGVALIAGGGYLILYEGYALTVTVQGVQVVSVATASTGGGVVITAGATSGILAGSATAIAGAGVVAVAYYKDGPSAADGRQPPTGNTSQSQSGAPFGSHSSANGPSGRVDISATMSFQDHDTFHRSLAFQQQRPRVVIANARTANYSAPAAPQPETGRAVGPAIISKPNTSIMFEPWLPKHPTDMQRYAYASWVNGWAEKTQSPDKFDPETPYTISRAEPKILDALTSLQNIQAAEDQQGEEQHQTRTNPVPDLAVEQAKGTGKELALSIMRGQDPREVYTLAKQAEIFWGAEASGVGKTALMAGTPEVIAGLGAAWLIDVGTVYAPFLASTAVSEGLKESSQELAAELRSKLDAYSRQRDKKFGSPVTARDVTTQTAINQSKGQVLKPAP
ncbi:hypothetical protein G8O24_21525 [Bradyrhizobium sp. INPA01-394B]|uniref:Uncharacterized protein n=1 Tax=Bradyrhizobium campsiandrae TaxID=1729892 RepID=A0ABR7U3P7_9BRAD|nr:hypothetical protein [Bradyrhizobium campsiandrae]MBC9879925.1 hypothetical protein [Bradyrhizobium campsiandrae]MBC9978610.1 hypothetical protein [Bradyrhizobium campsiandrae]